MQEPSPPPWHVKREIQLGHIITTLTIGVSVLLYITRLDSRIALIEQQLHQQNERDQRQDIDRSNALRSLREDIKELSVKFDRNFERTK